METVSCNTLAVIFLYSEIYLRFTGSIGTWTWFRIPNRLKQMVQLEKQVHHMEKDILFISEMEETYQ